MWQDQERQIRATYEQRLQQTFPERSAWGYIIAGVVVALLALTGFAPKLSVSATVFWSLVVGVVGGLIGKGWHGEHQKASDGYHAILKQRDEELTSVKSNFVISCPKCEQNLRIPRRKKLVVTCPTCRREFSHQG
jgi:hypothetical protein